MTQRTHLIATTAAALVLAFGCDVHIDVSESGNDAGEEGGEEEGGEEAGGEEEGGEEEGGEEAGGEEEGGEEEGGEEEGGEEGGEDTGTSGGESGGTSGGESFGDGEECSTYAQDCMPGLRCAGWSNDGANLFNATRCSPVDPSPADVGEQCDVEGGGFSGIDTCAAGSQCLDVDPVTNVGVCFQLCDGTPDDPICNDPSTSCVEYGGALPVCYPDK